MNKNVASLAVCQDVALRAGITGYDDGPVGSIKPKTEGLSQLSVMCVKGFHCHVLVSVDNARIDLMNIHFVSGGIGVLQPLSSVLNVDLIRLQEMIGHLLRSGRTVNLQRLVSPHDPWRKDDVGKSDCVISVQVGDETGLEVCRLQSVYPFVASRCSSPDQPGSKVHKIRNTVNNNCCARPTTLWVGQRSSGPQQNNLRFTYCFGLRLRNAGAEQDK